MEDEEESVFTGIIALVVSMGIFYGLLKLIEIMPFGDWFFDMVDASMRNIFG